MDKMITMAVSIICTAALAGCSSGNGNAVTEDIEVVPTNLPEEFEGTWIRDCYFDSVYRVNMLVANSDNTVISTQLEYSDAECAVNTATITRKWDIEWLNEATVTPIGNARHMNITIATEEVLGEPVAITGTVGFIVYTLILTVDSQLFFATNPSFTPDNRPTAISQERIWQLQ